MVWQRLWTSPYPRKAEETKVKKCWKETSMLWLNKYWCKLQEHCLNFNCFRCVFRPKTKPKLHLLLVILQRVSLHQVLFEGDLINIIMALPLIEGNFVPLQCKWCVCVCVYIFQGLVIFQDKSCLFVKSTVWCNDPSSHIVTWRIICIGGIAKW